MKTLLDRLRDGFLPATRHLAAPDLVELTRRSYREARTLGALYVLKKVPDTDTEHFLWQRLLAAAIQVTASLPDDPALRQAWLEGTALESAVGDVETVKLVRGLETGRGGFGTVAGMTRTLASRAQGHPFACSPDGSVQGELRGGMAFQGYTGQLHGGIIAALLDGAMKARSSPRACQRPPNPTRPDERANLLQTC